MIYERSVLINKNGLTAEQSKMKEKLLDIAIEVFIEFGFQHTGMLDISKRAGIAVGSIYTYFQSKNDLILEAINKITKTILYEIQLRVKYETNPYKQINTFIDVNFEIMSKRRDWATIMIFEIYVVPRRLLYNPQISNFSRYVEYIKSIFDEGVEQKIFKPANTYVLTLHLLGSFDYMVRKWILDDFSYDLDQFKQQLKDTFFNGIIVK